MEITNNEIKFIKSLSNKKSRDQSGLFIVEGEKMVEEALKSSFTVKNLYREDEIGNKTMSRITMLSSPSPVLAIVQKPQEHPFRIKDKGLFLALDSIRDPGNLGTIIRIADWFGIESILASTDTVDIYNPKVVQATMGAIFRVKFHYLDLQPALTQFTANGGTIYGAFLEGNNIYTQNLNTGEHSPVAIVIGNEANGISQKIENIITHKIHIPSCTRSNSCSESLNAAIATAITISEFRRNIKIQAY